jgi:hypothetical protein
MVLDIFLPITLVFHPYPSLRWLDDLVWIVNSQRCSVSHDVPGILFLTTNRASNIDPAVPCHTPWLRCFWCSLWLASLAILILLNGIECYKNCYDVKWKVGLIDLKFRAFAEIIITHQPPVQWYYGTSYSPKKSLREAPFWGAFSDHRCLALRSPKFRWSWVGLAQSSEEALLSICQRKQPGEPREHVPKLRTTHLWCMCVCLCSCTHTYTIIYSIYTQSRRPTFIPQISLTQRKVPHGSVEPASLARHVLNGRQIKSSLAVFANEGWRPVRTKKVWYQHCHPPKSQESSRKYWSRK